MVSRREWRRLAALFACRECGSGCLSVEHVYKWCATHEIVVVLEIAADGHLAGAVAARDVPFAPVVGVYAPRGEVVAVGGHLVAVGDHGVAVSHALVVHCRVCARSDVGEAQGRLRCSARGSLGVVLLGGRAGGVLVLLGGVGEGDVFLVGAQASWA